MDRTKLMPVVFKDKEAYFVLLFQYLAPFFTITDYSSTNQDAKNEPDFDTNVA
ncbi:hypothetical protein [Mucilaginibacter sp. OK283]|uniref:hypothetical protein n=1 Tax=Mucilaginibacter sp. OK283 TaxID=1881049 RepID=UPI0015A6F18E|nr:hypothetical protein [Mucilaginibacter sp. OK283]